jgi:hypothetical protein
MSRPSEKQGYIESRIMVNYKVELSVLRQRLPLPFRPRSIRGYGIAGFDLFRLAPVSRWQRRPSLLAVHRIEAEAHFENHRVAGPYVLRCDVPPGLRRRAFGSFFPNVMHTARLHWDQPSQGQHHLRMGRRQEPWIDVQAHQGDHFPFDSVMETLDTASKFFAEGQAWFAPRYSLTLFEQRRWAFSPWQVQPLLIDRLDASYFRRIMRFPQGAYFFDHALIQHDLTYQVTPPVELIAPRPVRLLFRDL